MPHDFDDDIDPAIIYRRRKAAKARKRLTLWVSVGGGVIVLVIAVAVVASMNKASGRGGVSLFGPSRSDWTHRELMESLQSSGLKVKMRPSGDFAAYLVKITPASSEYADAHIDYLDSAFNLQAQDILIVEICKTEREAKEKAGVQGSRGWSSGRFLFIGNSNSVKFLTEVKAAGFY